MLYDKGLASAEQLMLKLDFSDFVKRFERENMNIVEFGENIAYDTKIGIIRERLMEYATEQLPEQRKLVESNKNIES